MQKTLKEVRESKGVKKGAVARAMGVVYPTYQRYEETNRMPSDAFAKACDFLGVSRDDIFLETKVN
jgi:transcriptional regulator with XRE-family HTH domain